MLPGDHVGSEVGRHAEDRLLELGLPLDDPDVNSAVLSQLLLHLQTSPAFLSLLVLVDRDVVRRGRPLGRPAQLLIGCGSLANRAATLRV